jgi:hypothetical protein
MPVLTKAATPIKGTATLFTLDKVALVALGSVAADPYFSDSANWKSVQFNYKSSVGSQRKVVKFNASQNSPTSKFLVSARGRDVFLIQKIVIKDFDGGTFEVQSSELTTAEFDVDVTVVPPSSSALYTRNFVTLNSQQGYEVISGSSSSPLAFFPSGTEFTCAFGATNTYSNNDIAGFGLPNGTYKLKIYITSFSSTEMFRSMTLGLLNSGVNISYNALLAAVGSFVEVTITGSNLLGSLYYLQGVNCTIGMSKIEILALYSHDFASGEQTGQIEVGNTTLVSGKMLMIPTPSTFAGFETTITSFAIPSYPSPSDLHNVRLYFSDFVGSAFLSSIRVGSRSYGFIDVTTITSQNIIDGYIDFVDIQFGNYGGDRNFIVELYSAGGPSDVLSIKISKIEIY